MTPGLEEKIFGLCIPRQRCPLFLTLIVVNPDKTNKLIMETDDVTNGGPEILSEHQSPDFDWTGSMAEEDSFNFGDFLNEAEEESPHINRHNPQATNLGQDQVLVGSPGVFSRVSTEEHYPAIRLEHDPSPAPTRRASIQGPSNVLDNTPPESQIQMTGHRPLRTLRPKLPPSAPTQSPEQGTEITKTRRKRKPKARTLPDGDWERGKKRCIELYFDEGRSLSQVQSIMKNSHGLDAT